MKQSIFAFFTLSSLLLLFAASPIFVSCKSDTVDPVSTTPPSSGTTTTPGSGTTTTPGSGTSTTTVVSSTAFVGQTANLKFMAAAIARAGIASEVNQAGITIFAPSDDAFKAAGYASEAAISAAPVADLQRILRYHIIKSRIDQSAIPTAVNTSYETSLTDNRISVYKTV